MGELHAGLGQPPDGPHGLAGRRPGQRRAGAGGARARHSLPTGQVTGLVHGEKVREIPYILDNSK